MLSKIEKKIDWTEKALQSVGYTAGEVSAQEFHDYMTGGDIQRGQNDTG